MKKLPRNTLGALTLLVALFVAAPGVASSYWYFDWIGDRDLGYVGENGPALHYTHTFDPSHVRGDVYVTSVRLGVIAMDDARCYAHHGTLRANGCDWHDLLREPEGIAIALEDRPWMEGAVDQNFFYGDITRWGLISRLGDSFDVTIKATGGDAKIWRSALLVTYKKHHGPAIPEPGSAVVFGVGTLLIACASRRR